MKNIPGALYSHSTGKPFEVCLICEKSLVNPPVRHVVEKCIRNYKEYNVKDVIYEYAMCIDCLLKQQSYLSIESRNKIAEYLSEKLEILENDGEVPVRCSIYGTEESEMDEYIVQGLITDNHIDSAIPILLFGQKAMEEMQDLLSASTKEGLDDFMDTYFSGPPEFREILRERKTVII